MGINRKNLSPYQRQSLRSIERLMGISIATNILLQAILYRHHPGLAIRFGMAILSITPILVTIVRVTRYLKGEKDDYLRVVVVESMLWGLAATLVSDAFLSFLDLSSTLIIPLAGSLSLDIFIFIASLSLEIKLWSCR